MDNQCTATAKSTGERCQRPAIKGGTVCYQHGGAAPQVQKKAQERLDEMADATTAKLQKQLETLYERMENVEDDEKYVKLFREARQLSAAIWDRTGHEKGSKLEHSGDAGIVINVPDRDD